MRRTRRFTVGLLLLSGLCLALTGCWEKDTGSTCGTDATDPRAAQKAALAEKRHQALADHHNSCYESFVKHPSKGFGRIPVPEHANITYPKSIQLPAGADVINTTPAGQPLPEGLSPWTVEKMHLVSLLMNDKPAVYDTDAKSPFKRPVVRELDEFEAQALGSLQNGQQVVVLDLPGEVRMIGAIRARADCLKCHDGKKEGDLLGALTYSIKPVGK